VGGEKAGSVGKWQKEDFGTQDAEGTEKHGEESVRDGARAVGRFIEAVG
jgi:hypothetical protein